MHPRLIAAALAVAAPLVALPAGTAHAEPSTSRYIVQVKPDQDPRGLAQDVGARPKHVYENVFKGFAAELNEGQLNALQRNPKVERVAPDAEVSTTETQVMDAAGDPWGLDRIDERTLPLSGSYTFTRTGSGVRAYVLDTGIATTHPEFEGRALNMFNATSGSSSDCNGHGTHVAGTIGARTFGVAKKVYLRGVKVLSGDCSRSGYTSDVIEGLDWVRANGVKPAVVNMSIGGGYNWFLDMAVDAVSNAGFFVTAAAGNDNQDACGHSPGSAATAFTVAATTRSDAKASYSNWGPCVELQAPGTRIKSTLLNGTTGFKDGTSMAAPHVAGVVALLKQPGELSNATVRSWLTTNATTNVITGNVNGTPNRLLWKGSV